MNAREFENKALGLGRGIGEARQQFASSYLAGLDAGRNGTNSMNTHFCWFESRASSNDWSAGNKVGLGLRLRAEHATAKSGAKHD